VPRRRLVCRRPLPAAALADVTAPTADTKGTACGGGVGLEAVARLLPAPEALTPADGPPVVKLGFPRPGAAHAGGHPLQGRPLSRHLPRRTSNHEIGAAALSLLPGDPVIVAEQLRRHAPRVGLDPDAPPSPSRRLVDSVPSASAAGLEDLVLGVEGSESIRVTTALGARPSPAPRESGRVAPAAGPSPRTPRGAAGGDDRRSEGRFHGTAPARPYYSAV
jgi:hypothetical protein